MSDEKVVVDTVVETKAPSVLEVLTTKKVDTGAELVRQNEEAFKLNALKIAKEDREFGFRQGIDKIRENLDKIPDKSTRLAVEMLLNRKDPRMDEPNYTREHLHNEVDSLVTASHLRDCFARAERVGVSNFTRGHINRVESLKTLGDDLTVRQVEEAKNHIQYMEEVLSEQGRINIDKGLVTEVDFNNLDPMDRVDFEVKKKIRGERERLMKNLVSHGG